MFLPVDSTVLTGLLTAAAVLTWRGLPSTAGQRLAGLAARTASREPLRPVLLVGAAAAGALLLGGPVLGLLAAAAGMAALRQRRVNAQRRASQEEARCAVDACAALSVELSAGRSPAEALSVAAQLSVGPFGEGLARAAAAVRLGGDVPATLQQAALTSSVPMVLRGLAACWEVCTESGAGLARAVEQLAAAGRAESERRRDIAAELAGSRATAGLLAVLPVGGLLMASGLGADPVHQLLHTPIGGICAVLGFGLELLGLAWTARIVRKAGEA